MIQICSCVGIRKCPTMFRGTQLITVSISTHLLFPCSFLSASASGTLSSQLCLRCWETYVTFNPTRYGERPATLWGVGARGRGAGWVWRGSGGAHRWPVETLPLPPPAVRCCAGPVSSLCGTANQLRCALGTRPHPLAPLLGAFHLLSAIPGWQCPSPSYERICSWIQTHTALSG